MPNPQEDKEHMDAAKKTYEEKQRNRFQQHAEEPNEPPPNAPKTRRNALLFTLHKQGLSLRRIGRKFGISGERVRQVLDTDYHAEGKFTLFMEDASGHQHKGKGEGGGQFTGGGGDGGSEAEKDDGKSVAKEKRPAPTEHAPVPEHVGKHHLEDLSDDETSQEMAHLEARMKAIKEHRAKTKTEGKKKDTDAGQKAHETAMSNPEVKKDADRIKQINEDDISGKKGVTSNDVASVVKSISHHDAPALAAIATHLGVHKPTKSKSGLLKQIGEQLELPERARESVQV